MVERLRPPPRGVERRIPLVRGGHVADRPFVFRARALRGVEHETLRRVREADVAGKRGEPGEQLLVEDEVAVFRLAHARRRGNPLAVGARRVRRLPADAVVEVSVRLERRVQERARAGRIRQRGGRFQTCRDGGHVVAVPRERERGERRAVPVSGLVEPRRIRLAEIQQALVARQLVDDRRRFDDRGAGVVRLLLPAPVLDEPQQTTMDGIEDRLVARAVVFEQHRVVEPVAAPGVIVLLAVVVGAERAQVAVRLLERHRGLHARGGFRDERGVVQRVGEHRRADGVFAAHLGTPSHHSARPVGGIVVARDVGLLHLVGLDLAEMPAHAGKRQLQLPLQPPARDDLPRLQRFENSLHLAHRRHGNGNCHAGDNPSCIIQSHSL